MSLQLKLAAAFATALALGATAARADVLLSDTTPPVERPVDTSFTETFDSLYAGVAALNFVLDGYGSLDGQNWYEDDFTLSLNGTPIIRGTWNLGGGGFDVVYLGPLGSSFQNISGNGTDVTWNGGHVNIGSWLNLLGGSNTLTFNYHALTNDHAGWQDMGDEGWSAHDIVVTQNAFREALASATVPETGTWGLMILGFGAVGAALRRRRTTVAFA